jgi:hypothetical protein
MRSAWHPADPGRITRHSYIDPARSGPHGGDRSLPPTQSEVPSPSAGAKFEPGHFRLGRLNAAAFVLGRRGPLLEGGSLDLRHAQASPALRLRPKRRSRHLEETARHLEAKSFSPTSALRLTDLLACIRDVGAALRLVRSALFVTPTPLGQGASRACHRDTHSAI